jgi:uncharacterized protein (TIRG00374 family)
MIAALRENFIPAYNYFVQYKRVIFFILKIFIGIGLILFLFHFINVKEILISLENVNFIFLLAAVGLVFVNLYFQFLKWKLTCNYFLNEHDNSKIFSSLFYGFAGGSFTPARIGEYIGRNLAFNNKTIFQVLTATFIDKFFTLIFVTCLGSLGCIIFINSFYTIPYYLTLALVFAIVLFFYLILKFLFNGTLENDFFLKKLISLKLIAKHSAKIKTLFQLSRQYSLKMLHYSFLFYLTFLIQFTLLFAAFSNHTEIVNYFWVAILIMFSKTFIPPISIGEVGVREGISVFFLTKMGETASAAFNASIFLFMINILLPALIGLFLIFRRRND